MDSTWEPVKDYIRSHIEPNDRDKCYFDSYDPSEIGQVINTQRKVINYQKNINIFIIFLIVIDDLADDTKFTPKSQLLHQLYIRGRHYMISTITSTQVYKQMSPIVKKNVTHLFIYRLRNYNDLESIVEDLSAIYDEKDIATNIS